MDTETIPPMKPVLVEKISDDAQVIRQDEVTQQKTLLTVRGISDLFKCSPIQKTNPSDVGYFNAANKVDLNLVVDSSSRSLEADQYVNGPETHIKEEGTHTEKTVVFPAFLYVFTILPSGEMTWTDYDGQESIPESGNKVPNKKAPSPRIRQMLFSSAPNDEYGNGTPWSRYGTWNEVSKSYDWENWFIVGKIHDGPEYFSNFIINQTAPCEITNPTLDSNYRIYSQVTKFELPDANDIGCKCGKKINILMCAPTIEGRQSVANIVYNEKTSSGELLQQMNMILTPRLIKTESGSTVDNLVVAEYTFEIVKLYDANGVEIGQTWELESDVEESDYTDSLAQFLSEHIQGTVNDIVKYNRESIPSTGIYKIAYPLQSAGYIQAKFLKNSTLVNDQWKAYVKLVNADSGAVFTHVTDLSVAPSPLLTYYVKVETGSDLYYTLAENNGHPTSFDTTKDYYSLNETNENTVDVIDITDPDGSKRSWITLNDFVPNKRKCFSKFASRNDIVVVVVDPGSQTHSYYRDTVMVEPEVAIYPDPHDTYLQKKQVNPSAFTEKQLMELKESGAIIDDGEGSIEDAPVSTRALIAAYKYIAQKLQRKGVLLGSVLLNNLDPKGLDALTSDGSFVAVPRSGALDDSTNTFPPGTPSYGGNLVVLSNKNTSSTIIHEDEGTITEATSLFQFFVYNDNNSKTAATYIRSAVKDGELWVWSEWKELGSDSSGGKIIDKTEVDLSSYIVIGNEVRSIVTKEMIDSALKKYSVPIFMVGIKSCASTTVPEAPHDPIFVSSIVLPDATRSQLSEDYPQKRRELEIWFYGTNNDLELGWKEKKLRVQYQGLNKEYSYERTWKGGEAISKIRFVQIDMPGNSASNPERLWIPEEVG